MYSYLNGGQINIFILHVGVSLMI